MPAAKAAKAAAKQKSAGNPAGIEKIGG